MFTVDDAHRLLHSSNKLSPEDRLTVAHLARQGSSEWSAKDIEQLEAIAAKAMATDQTQETEDDF